MDHAESKAIKNGFRIWNVVPTTKDEAHYILEHMDVE